MQRKQHQVFLGLDKLGEMFNDLLVLQVAALRYLYHGEVMTDDEMQAIRSGGIKAQAVGYVFGYTGTLALVAVSLNPFAGVMQQQSKIRQQMVSGALQATLLPETSKPRKPAAQTRLARALAAG